MVLVNKSLETEIQPPRSDGFTTELLELESGVLDPLLCRGMVPKYSMLSPA